MASFERYCYLCNQGPITGAQQWEQHINGKKHKKNEWTKGSSMQSDLPDDKRSTKFVPSHNNVVDIVVPVMFDEDDDMAITNVECTPVYGDGSFGSKVGAPAANFSEDSFPALSSKPAQNTSVKEVTTKVASVGIGRGRGRGRPNPQPSGNPSAGLSWSSIAGSGSGSVSKPQPQPVMSVETERRPLTQSERSGNVRVIHQPEPSAQPMNMGNRPMAKTKKCGMAKRIYHEYKANKKTASQALQEIATTLMWVIEAEEVAPSAGSFYNYAMRWKIDGQFCEAGEGSKKKTAKENASRKALARFGYRIEKPDKDVDENPHDTKEQSVSRTLTNPSDDYKRLTMLKVDELVKSCRVRLAPPARFAAFILTRGHEQPASDGVVVAFGSGRSITKMTNSDAVEAYGYRLHDMQAVVMAKRAFQAYLYGQLSQSKRVDSSKAMYKYGENILEFNPESERYRLRDGVRIHLYLSHPTNGDATAYVSDEWSEPEAISDQDLTRDLNGILHPEPEDPERGYGRLRVVTDPIRGHTALLGDDGITPRGHVAVSNMVSETDKVRIMSLSDKVLKWNHLGVQGGLLTHFIEPVFLHSIQMGSGYAHGHIARALITRVPLSVFPKMPDGYRNPVDPYLGRPSKSTKLRSQIEGPVAINWFLGTTDVEVINCEDGLIDLQTIRDPDAVECSRLSRVTMLQRFEARWTANLADGDVISTSLTKRLRKTLGTRFKETDYLGLKNASEDYQEAKRQLYSSLSQGRMGTWKRKENLQKFTLGDYEEDA